MDFYQCDGWVTFQSKSHPDITAQIKPMTLGESRQHGLKVAAAMVRGGDDLTAPDVDGFMSEVFRERVLDVTGASLVSIGDSGARKETPVTTGGQLYDVAPEDLRLEIFEAVIHGEETARGLEKKSPSQSG